jgi:copper(I)-binding protein
MHARFAVLPFSLAMALAGCRAVPADARHDGPFVVREAWVRAADSGATGGAYLTLANADTTSLTIVAMSTPVAATTELHETMQMSGVVHMMARPDFVLARDSVLTMAPGGLHLMLTGLNRTLHAGDTVSLTLTLADGRTVPVSIPVRAP